jgi:hypothetical protein
MVDVPKHHIMKTYGEVKTYIQAFLASTLDKWPAYA